MKRAKIDLDSLLSKGIVCRILRVLACTNKAVDRATLVEKTSSSPAAVDRCLGSLRDAGIIKWSSRSSCWRLVREPSIVRKIEEAIFEYELSILKKTRRNLHAEEKLRAVDEIASAVFHARNSLRQ